MAAAKRGSAAAVAIWADEVASGVKVRLMAAVERARVAETDLPPADEVADRISDLILTPGDDTPNRLSEHLGPFWSGTKVQRELRLMSRQALDERRKTGRVLALKTSDNHRIYPVSQFQRRGNRVEVKPELVSMLSVLRDHDPWSVAVLLRTPAPELENLTPLDWIHQGRETAATQALAHRVSREWSH
jgi:hypothetical protein